MDYNRQSSIFDPTCIKGKSVSIIGSGATGSAVALQLAMMGWGNTPQGQGILKLFDGDTLAEHNLCNQIGYEISQIGKFKVEAMRETIMRKCGFQVKAFPYMVDDQPEVKSTYVFLLTDTMNSRKEIFEKLLWYSFETELVIETRMGIKDGRVYAFNPHVPSEVEEWRSTLYTDEEAEVSLCGSSQSIVTTAQFVASLAVSRLIQHFNLSATGQGSLRGKDGRDPPMWNEMQFSLYPETFFCRIFGQSPRILLL